MKKREYVYLILNQNYIPEGRVVATSREEAVTIAVAAWNLKRESILDAVAVPEGL